MRIGVFNPGFIQQFVVSVLIFTASLGLNKTTFAAPFEIKDGDRIVLVGATFIERDVRYGCIETVMTTHFDEYDLTFRNLGWSGDNVFGIARASFDSVLKGYERLINQVNEAKPTVLLISYGQNESFKGEAGLDEFVAGYNKLLDDLAPNKARTVLISPALHENMGTPLPDPAAHNADVRTYTKAIANIAKKRKLHFIDMTKALPVSRKIAEAPLTNNGLHFTEAGYWEAAKVLMNGLGYKPAPPDRQQLAPLREIINEKNRLFFIKWRPQNATYITGFRKHEQGRHVAEFPQYDPLVAEQEVKIAALRRALSGKGAPSQ
jgi:lysophospholipase L1-like esterase